jgi:hypothetical protein
MKFFNTTGPVNAERHYCLPIATRLNEQELRTLIEEERYFVLHAPRQTGKTSTMINFARQLNVEGTYAALYVNVEAAQACRGNVNEALPGIIQAIETRVSEQLPENYADFRALFVQLKKDNVPANILLATLLSQWAAQSPKPIILFIDEMDSLIGDTLLSVLRQLRSGYDKRPRNFPQSICLMGVRDVRDYRVWSEQDQQMVLGGSAFNIKADSIRMGDFSLEQVHTLYQQHTTETGQIFEPEAINYAFHITQGQPWLVNALANELVRRLQTDRQKAITQALVEQAKENLIRRRDTHLDVLIDRLQELRVRNIMDAIIMGSSTSQDFPWDDIQYLLDLGLVVYRDKNLVIANPIYQEVLPRELTHSTQLTMPQQSVWYINADGSINMPKMLTEFTQFYRENSGIWLEKFAYKESGPHLFIMAFLQRIINGGGTVTREYALGTNRVDILITWKTQRIVIELKVWHSQERTWTEGLAQTARYMDTAGATEGHLVIFDKRDKTWDEKIYTRQEVVGHHKVTVWGM